jgi:hypothetical protein
LKRVRKGVSYAEDGEDSDSDSDDDADWRPE